LLRNNHHKNGNKTFGDDIIHLLLVVLQVALNSRWNNGVVIRYFFIVKTLVDFFIFLPKSGSVKVA
jgi:hypothetical protein